VIMLNYMPKVGKLGLDMMYRTCTVQTNLDYSSEADMVLKLRVGLALQPTAPLAVGGLWMLFAFCVAGATAGYITVGQMFPPEQTARVATAVNTLTLGAAFVLQAAVGWVLDLWPRTASGGWDPRGYSAALAVSLAVQLFVALRLLGGKRLEFS